MDWILAILGEAVQSVSASGSVWSGFMISTVLIGLKREAVKIFASPKRHSLQPHKVLFLSILWGTLPLIDHWWINLLNFRVPDSHLLFHEHFLILILMDHVKSFSLCLIRSIPSHILLLINLLVITGHSGFRGVQFVCSFHRQGDVLLFNWAPRVVVKCRNESFVLEAHSTFKSVFQLLF